jgi:hypothetical protein
MTTLLGGAASGAMARSLFQIEGTEPRADKRSVQARYVRAKGFNEQPADVIALANQLNTWFAGAIPEARLLEVVVLSDTDILVLYTES